MWIALAATYGLLKGIRDVMKKVALKKSSTVEVLFFYTLLSFVFVLPWTGEAMIMLDGNARCLALIAVKSLIIYAAWICSFKAIENLPIGFYGLMDMSRVVITSVMSVTLLGEAMSMGKVIGMVLVIDGLVILNLSSQKTGSTSNPSDSLQTCSANAINNSSPGGENTSWRYIGLVLISCCMNSCSEILDKWFMRPETGITTGQLQFWYLFFLCVFYVVHIIIKRIHIDFRNIYRNYPVIILAILFVIGDKCLFIANQTGSVIPMTLLKQCAVIITILGGKLVFKEKNIIFKLLCAVVVICGILVGIGI